MILIIIQEMNSSEHVSNTTIRKIIIYLVFAVITGFVFRVSARMDDSIHVQIKVVKFNPIGIRRWRIYRNLNSIHIVRLKYKRVNKNKHIFGETLAYKTKSRLMEKVKYIPGFQYIQR